jgi:predicted lipoprotein with Yx(FWY)xxD motif
MRRSIEFLIPTLAASLLLAACGSSSSSNSSSATASSQQAAVQSGNSAASALVKTASNSKLGATLLVNAQGLTLYRLSGEQNGKFICTSSACLQVWHPLTAMSASAPTGSIGSLGIVKRPDGSEQITYKGMPLYTFAQDKSPGQANGQGIKDVGTWSAVTTSASTKSSPPAQTSTPASSGGNSYGY